MKKSDVGLFGLAVMGSNLARNLESRGYQVSVCNRTTSVTHEFVQEFSGKNFVATDGLEQFVKSIQQPRKIILMVKAGEPTDAVIEGLTPFLELGDILIDGGNAWFKDTKRRGDLLAKIGVNFIGAGISGGETGALNGPSIMPGGPKHAWEKVAEMFAKIAANVDGPCTNYIGPDGSGHFVKMVHNGIEYADMQLIAECYQVLTELAQFKPEQLAETFEKWNQGVLSSFLIEISTEIFKFKDPQGDGYLVDKILDRAGQKGTGQWTSEVALELGIPVPTIAAAVTARTLSSFKDQRVIASKILPALKQVSDLDQDKFATEVHNALYAAKIIAYAQGMALIQEASNQYNWDLKLDEIAALWKGGCIIRARFLGDITKAYQANPKIANLMLADFMTKELEKNIPSLRKVVADACLGGVPVMALATALSYYDCYRSENLPQNLTQAQRDFFGAHTYQRKDMDGTFHTEWEK